MYSIKKLERIKEVMFEFTKLKYLPVLLYHTEVCPTNSADRHALQFTIK